MKDKQKVQLKTGMSVSCKIYTDDQKDAGDFVLICSYCGFEFWDYSKDATQLICQKCDAIIGRLLKGKWERPPDSPSRKVFMFVTDIGVSYIWHCHCGYELNHLANNLSYTTCEKCQAKTSRHKDITTMAITDKITWDV